MAVQAAIMNPHFIHFCFPGSSMEYEMESAYSGALLAERESSGEVKEATSALLNFIDSASSNIKLALDKPVKSKRKVNHRKYLQKQIKRCTGMISGGSSNSASGQEAVGKRQLSPPSASSTTPTGHFQCKPPPKKDGSQSSLQSKSLAALFDSVRDLRRSAAGDRALAAAAVAGSSKKVPLRNRNLPPSFFTEPANVKINSTSGMSLKDLERGNPEAAEFFELLGPDYSNMISAQEPFLGSALRIQQEGNCELGSYDSYRGLTALSGSFPHFPDPWLPCNPPKKSPTAGCNLAIPEAARTVPVQTPLYPSNPPPNSSSLEEPPVSLASFPQFFPECSLPQLPYEYNPGYNCSRQNFPGL
ncbi:protein FAM181B [Carcharodon carcharias]|uniref:protein FAM181B n=1 Tax=Carcharodon carcharias TaxID=13397 RepID=UPI001B7E1206|nr:protein FAM181B [Carcharodon carcharias]